MHHQKRVPSKRPRLDRAQNRKANPYRLDIIVSIEKDGLLLGIIADRTEDRRGHLKFLPIKNMLAKVDSLDLDTKSLQFVHKEICHGKDVLSV